MQIANFGTQFAICGLQCSESSFHCAVIHVLCETCIVQYSVQRNVQCSAKCSVQCSVQCSVYRWKSFLCYHRRQLPV